MTIRRNRLGWKIWVLFALVFVNLWLLWSSNRMLAEVEGKLNQMAVQRAAMQVLAEQAQGKNEVAHK